MKGVSRKAKEVSRKRKATGGAKTHLRLQLLVLTLAACILGGVIPAALAQLHPGNILVIDGDKGTGSNGALFSVDTATGARTILSDFGNPAQGELGVEPTAVAIDAEGRILVVDIFAGGPGGTLFAVNPTTGARTILSNFGNPAQGVVGRSPLGVAVDGSNILVIDDEAVSSGFGALFRVDPVTGVRTVVSDFSDLRQGPQSRSGLNAVAVDATGNILVLDMSNRVGLRGALFKVDPSSGNRTILSDFANPAQGVLGSRLSGVAIDASGNIWVTDNDGGTDDRGILLRVDPVTGTRTVVSDFGDPTQGVRGIDPEGVAVGASGKILVTDLAGGQDTADRGALFSVDPATGARTVVSNFGDPATGELGVELRGVAVAPTPQTQPVDLTIANMEITQGIQNFANDVPLVQDKTTYVRVYPAVDIADRRVGARLRGFREGSELPGSPLRPLYPLASVHTGGASRAALNDSFNFWVPPSWRSGLVSFQAEINFGGAIPETDTGNNVFSLPAEFIPKAPVCVVMIPVRTHGSLYTVDTPGFDRIIARFGSLWPVPDVWVYSQSEPVEELQARLGIPPFTFGPYELPDDGWKVITSLIARDTFTDDPDECDNKNARTHYVGMVSPDTDTGSQTGYANYEFAASYVKMETDLAASNNVPFYTPAAGATMAQELAHNYNGIFIPIIDENRRWFHVNCGGPEDINPDYPYPTDQIGPVDHDSKVTNSLFWGFDPIAKMIIAPDGAADYMSYCPPKWVSDYNWKGIFDEIHTLGSARVRALGTTAALTQSAEVLVLGGVITPTVNVASFEYAYRLPQGILGTRKLERLQSSLNSVNGAYTLELVGTNGAVLFSQPFDSTGSFEGDSRQVFFVAVPFSPNTARIRITQNRQELGALTVSAHAPQVRLLQPRGGQTITDSLTIQWEASDLDNDTLFYTVQYSPDLGARWHSLITQTPETTLTLSNTSSLPGSNQKALIRVIATDGVNTGSATSDPFTVQSHAPVVHVDTPSDHALFALNSQIILMGGGRDAEDGPLGDQALTWLVNGQRRGTGKEAAVGGLAPGTYTITLQAVDSDNNTAAASVTITIVDGVPVASADSYNTRKNTQLTVVAPGVLGNDIDTAGGPLSAVLVSNVSRGTLALNSDGSFAYGPQADFSGADSFTYKANNGTADSNVVTVSLTVIEVDTTPPVITISANPSILWPPNGKMVPISVSGTITDAGSGVNPSTATYAVTDEYGSVQPRGSVTVGPTGRYSFTIQLQASRHGDDTDGRQYTISIRAQDNAGNTGAASAGVTVPHDRR